MEKQQHNHHHDHNHEHQHNGHESEAMQAGDIAIQSAFSVGLFLLKGLILVLFITWLFFSGYYKVENGDAAIEMYLGKINPYHGKNVRTENFYFGLPFPFTEVIILPVKKEYSIRVDSFQQDPNEPVETSDDPLVKGQRNYYVSKDMNLLHLGWDMTYRIKELDKFIVLFYEAGDINKGSGIDKPWVSSSKNLLIQLSRGAMMEECSKQNAMDILTGKNINQTVRDQVQSNLDKMQTGIEITSLSMAIASPPSSVRQSFVEVLNAKQRKIQVVTESQKKKEEFLLAINSEVKKIELDSQNEIVELVQGLKAEASRVETIKQLFKDNPVGLKNYLHQLYLEVASGIIADKSVEFIDRPENTTFRTPAFAPNKEKPASK